MYETQPMQKVIFQKFLEKKCVKDSYTQYKICFDEPISININVIVDNIWVVPYNPSLMLKCVVI